MDSYFPADDREIVLKYFQLIEEKDMHNLLNLFTGDSRIYEPFSKGHISGHKEVVDKPLPLKGRSEIGSFLYIVMMACDGLKYEIKFESESLRRVKLPDDTLISTSPSVVPTLATFYKNEVENKLRQKIIFHIVSEPNNDPADEIARNRENNSNSNNHSTDKDVNIGNNKRRIKSLYVQFLESK